MKKFKNPLLFCLCLLPVALVAGYFTAVYQFGSYDPAIMEEALAQIGSMEVLIAITVAQTVMYALVCGFVGYVLAEKLGLMRPFRFEKAKLLPTLLFTVVAGAVFSLDYWTFGKAIPQVAVSYEVPLTAEAVIASVLYGGVVEEVMMRLCFMTLIAFFVRKVFFKKSATVPEGVFIGVNIAAAMLFAAGHLPATMVIFGEITPLILFRCFLLNGGLGLVFGRMYRKYGIQYAMLAHAGCHIISKLVWWLFI